jgi:DNA polymerase III delta subunit
VKNPPVLVVAGTDEFQRRRLVRKVTSTRAREGWNVLPVDAGVSGDVEESLASTSLFGANTLLVVSRAEKLAPSLLRSQLDDPDPSVVLLLVTDADKLVPPLDSVPKALVKTFSLPAFYKMEEHASAFCVEEAKSHKRELAPSLATALVRKVGTDLGVLAFEIQKAVLYSTGSDKLTADHFRVTVAPLLESDGSAIADALAAQNRKMFLSEMDRFRKAKGGDPTVELCGRVISPTVLRWLQAAHLHASGLSPQAAAGSVGANPWFWEHKVLPAALRWKVSGCAQIIRVVASAQEATFRGSVSPWGVLEAGMIRAFPG